MLGNRRMFWNVRATPSSVTRAGSSGSGRPDREIVPDVGVYWPVRQLNSVVLPAPLGPISPMISPSVSANDTSFNARRPPNCMETPDAANTGLVMRAPPPSPSAPSARPRPAERAPVHPPAPPPVPVGDEPLRAQPHEHDEPEPEQQEPVVGELAQLLRQHEQDRRAEHRAGDRAHAAEDDGREQRDRLGEPEAVVGDDRGLVGEERPGEPGQHRAREEREDLDRAGADAHRPCGVLVLPDRDPRPAQPRILEMGEDQHDERDEQHDQHVVQDTGREPDRADDDRLVERRTEQRHLRDVRDRVRAAGEAADVVLCDASEDLAEGERDDGEVVAAHPQGRRADDRAEAARHDRADDHDDRERQRDADFDAAAPDRFAAVNAPMPRNAT